MLGAKMLYLVPPTLNVGAAVAAVAAPASPNDTALMTATRPELASAARRLEHAKARLAWAEDAAKRSHSRSREADVLAACDEVLHARVDFLRLLSVQGLSVPSANARLDLDETIAELELGALGG